MEEINEEERGADEAGKHGNDVVVDVDDDPWVKQMEEKLASKSKQCQPSHPFTICKVPRVIREVDDAAYRPLVVSNGPYHRRDPNLLDMQQVKWRNLNAFRSQAGIHFNNYLKAMKEIEPRARDCYSGNIDMDADEFVEMMLLDGLFMIELFSPRGKSSLFLNLRFFRIEKEEPIYTLRGMSYRVGQDIVLLENQLPFFVLERLWNLTDQRSWFDLWKCACTFIRDFFLPIFQHEWDLDLLQVIFDEEFKKKDNPEMTNEDGVHHLLHLVYLLLQPTSLTSTKKSKLTTGSSSESMEPTTGSISESMEPTTGSISESMEPTTGSTSESKIIPFLSPSKSEPPPLDVIPSAVELDEAGVEFKCVNAKSFLDVKFEQGTMKMPRLSVQDPTISLLRNFIAYEQCFPDRSVHITSYCVLMDYLVNTPRDVEILKRSAIIENQVGSDEVVARLFNDLCKEIVLPGKDSYLAESFDQLTKYTQKTWPKWRAKLKHDYFGNPWAIISLIAATFVVFLTAVQTYKAAFT